jgi:hypothetical protein
VASIAARQMQARRERETVPSRLSQYSTSVFFANFLCSYDNFILSTPLQSSSLSSRCSNRDRTPLLNMTKHRSCHYEMLNLPLDPLPG